MNELALINRPKIDRKDFQAILIISVIYVLFRSMTFLGPDFSGYKRSALFVAVFFTIMYIFDRARKHPGKLEEWGLVGKITPWAVMSFLMILGAGIGFNFILGRIYTGDISFEPHYVNDMVFYVFHASLQQFCLCSIILVSLNKIESLSGNWKLPLIVGVIFALVHIIAPSKIPGTKISLQLIYTFPFGILGAWYFLKFRLVLPIVFVHATLYVLLKKWVEVSCEQVPMHLNIFNLTIDLY